MQPLAPSPSPDSGTEPLTVRVCGSALMIP